MCSKRLTRAKRSLEGLSVGDALGGFFEMSSPHQPSHFVVNRTPPQGTWHFTDDTNMALSIYSVLCQYGYIDQDALAESFATHYDRSRGYGRGMRALIARMRDGQDWREITRSFYGGAGSFGNGGAMRVAPIGAYFADDIEAVIENARASAEITHAHPEGIAGAVAVAVAASIAYTTRFEHDLSRRNFIGKLLPHVPAGDVHEGCVAAMNLPDDITILQVVDALGNGSDMSAQRTIPLVIWCAATFRHSYEEAIWQTLAAGGDTDTTCAMVGGIVAMCDDEMPIPQMWLAQREALPEWAVSC